MPIIILIVWLVIAKLNIFSNAIFPNIGQVIELFINQLTSGQLINDILTSFIRVIQGYLIAALLGVALGVLMGINKNINSFFYLTIISIRQILAWIPLIVLWFGIWVMGSAMAINLSKSGHNVSVFNRSISKCEPLKDFGIEVKNSIKECVRNADAIFTIVGYPKDVEEVYLGEEGIFKYAKEGAYLVDMTTSSPILSKKLYELGDKFHILDAPVSGGDIGAQNATLSIMVGGNKEDFEYMYNIFEYMGKNIIYLGEAGSGQNCKACNQVAIAGTVAAVAE